MDRTRRPDIDWLRVAATYLLFLFHVGKVFDPAPFYHVRNAELAFAMLVVCGFISLWHMPLFFLLAGWSAASSLAARGARGFVAERVRRLAIPLLAGCVLLAPAIKYLELRSGLDLSHTALRAAPALQDGFRTVIPSGLPIAEPFDEPFLTFLPTFFTHLDRFTWSHLWFVAYLFTLTMAYLPAFAWLVHRRDRLSDLGSWAVYVPLVPLAGIQLTMRSRWPGIYNLYNDWANIAYYTVFLVAGFLLACHPALERLVAREWKRSLAVAGIATTVLLIAVLGVLRSPTILLVGSAVAGWCFVVALLGIGQRVFTRSSAALAYLSESAFPVYVLHQAAIVVPGYFLVRLPLGIATKFGLLLVVSVGVTLAAYQWLVRPFAVPRFLLGMRPKVYPLRRPVTLSPSDNLAVRPTRPFERTTLPASNVEEVHAHDPIGSGLLRVAVFASVLAAASQAEAVCVSSGCTDPTAVETVRALVSSACKCVGTSHGRYLRCAKGIIRPALRGGSTAPRPVTVRQQPGGGSRCTDTTAVENVRALVSSACERVGTRLHGRSLRCAKGIVRAALRAGPKMPPPIPSPVAFRQEPEVALGDPAFEALPGARADFGRLGGAVYQIEVPEKWNGRLVLQMHGYEELGPEANVTAPDIRTYLVLHGYAWGASSFSSTSWIAGRAADETAALWDYFTQKYGRPCWTYVTGISMGGAATHIAAERYPDRFDGGLGLCGSPGFLEGAMGGADYFAAGAYVAGVRQAEFDASTDAVSLIRKRILPALQDPAADEQFENIMLDLTGGPRAFDREGFRVEENLNWRRAEQLVATRLATNAGTTYRLGPLSTISSDEFNSAAIRLTTNDELLRSFTEGNETTGDVKMPLLSLYTTGDGQVPIEQASILRRRVEAAAKTDLLVQRVFRDASHCGFSTAEQEKSFAALVGWVEHGVKPEGQDVLVDDLRTLGGPFELNPRGGTPEADAVPGAADRVVVQGSLTLDGTPLDAPYLGAIVRRDGLITPCQYNLPSVDNGRYEITVLADAEASGCGAPGAEVLLWTFARNQQLYSREWVAWPGNGATVTSDASFSVSAPDGAAPPTVDFIGEVFRRDGDQLPPGTRVEAYVGNVRCGVASTRRTGNYGGYILSVVGPDSVAGCDRDATLTFRIDGRRATTTAVNAPGDGRSLDLILGRGPSRRGACSQPGRRG